MEAFIELVKEKNKIHSDSTGKNLGEGSISNE